jgi:hypothetical protein
VHTLKSFAAQVDRVSDRQLATLIGAALFAIAGWPLLLLRIPPYQDLPDHLATVCVLLDPSRYPQFLPNGWLKANSLFVGGLYLLAKGIGPMPAARLVSGVAVAATALTLPHFVLSFTDRRRLLVASLVLAPMVHHWFVLMGMLGFSLAFALGLWTLVLLARQAAQPSVIRGLALAVIGVVLWFLHGIALLLVGLMAAVEALMRPGPRGKLLAAMALLVPFVPIVPLLLMTIARQAAMSGGDPIFGRLNEIGYQSNLDAVYALWAHQFFGLSPLSAAGLIPALALAVWSARRAQAAIPLLSIWALVALSAVYLLVPHTLPALGYVNERAIPFLWAWALVRVPSRVSAPAASVLVLASLGWASGLAADLFRAGSDLDDFTAAAPQVAEGARLLTLNFAPRVSSRNTSSLLHASGMYTVLRGVKPQDVWADSPSMPIRYATRPTFVEDPLAIREFLGAARTPEAYCQTISRAGLPRPDCRQAWATAWSRFWHEVELRYDYILLWGAPAEVVAITPEVFETRVNQGRLKLLARSTAAAAR